MAPPEVRARALANRRAYERLTMSELRWLEQVKLKYGPTVTLLDLSSGGAHIETVGHRLQPGTTVVIEIAGSGGEFAVPSRVVRCQMSGIVPQPTYRGALEFKRVIQLPATPAPEPVFETDANPLHEYARLSATLRRASVSNGVSLANVRLTDVGVTALAAAQALIESPAGRRAGAPFLQHTSRLVKAVTRSLEERTPTEKLLDELTEAVRRTVPAISVRLADASSVALQSADAIALDVRGPGASTKLIVEFQRGRQIEPWHMQVIKSAAHLFTLTKDVERARSTSVPEGETPKELVGWHRVVARYVDGRVLKGYGRDFVPSKGFVKIWSAPDGPAETRISVPLTSLKAVFFVHDLDGIPYVQGAQPASSEPGRPIVITFNDGEVMQATTFNYSETGTGFFVTPVGAKTNNIRLFVVNNAVTRVQLP